MPTWEFFVSERQSGFLQCIRKAAIVLDQEIVDAAIKTERTDTVAVGKDRIDHVAVDACD